jgi:hypothetical protein
VKAYSEKRQFSDEAQYVRRLALFNIFSCNENLRDGNTSGLQGCSSICSGCRSANCPDGMTMLGLGNQLMDRKLNNAPAVRTIEPTLSMTFLTPGSNRIPGRPSATDDVTIASSKRRASRYDRRSRRHAQALGVGTHTSSSCSSVIPQYFLRLSTVRIP